MMGTTSPYLTRSRGIRGEMPAIAIMLTEKSRFRQQCQVFMIVKVEIYKDQ